MNKEKRRVPKLRFPGFTEDWEQRKFSEITYLSGIKNKENKPYESYSISNEFGFIPQNEQFEHGGTMKTADKSMYYIVTQNSFAYNPARINVGSIGYYDKPDNVIVSSLYEVFKTTEIVNDKFLWHWFKSNQFNHLIEKYQEGGVRLYFYYDKLCKGAIELPTIDEQNKISNLLNGLDLFITLHQRKLEHLKLKKKAFLQKLFPKNGERYPELRFPGFTDAWEQRKLGDFTNQINTFVNPEDAKLPLWSLTAEAGLIEKSDRYERDFLVKKKDQFKRIETNTLVYNPMNITIGSIDIYTGLYPIAVSGYYVSIVYDKNIDTDFLKEVLLLPSSLKMYKNYATGSLIERQRVQYPTFSKLQLLFPNLDEQKAIGQFFKSLNLDVTLHQRKLEHLQLQKKALLQQMFV